MNAEETNRRQKKEAVGKMLQRIKELVSRSGETVAARDLAVQRIHELDAEASRIQSELEKLYQEIQEAYNREV